MKEKETKIGKFRVIYNDQGLGFVPVDESSVIFACHFFPSEIEELKRFISLNEKKEIPYLDRTYLDKRRILRQLSVKDEIRNYVNIMTDKIWEKLIPNNFNFIKDIELYHYVKSLLIDGYLAFEKIFDEKQKDIIDLTLIDPITLTSKFYSSVGERKNDFDWIQYPDNDKLKRILLKNQVIYITYSSDDVYSPTSYVEELKESYEKMKRIENELVISRAGINGNLFKKRKVTFAELKRADKQLQFMSKIPKSILEDEEKFSDDVRYNSFITKISDIFKTKLFDNLIETKNNIK